jgi:hypothetical protein
LRREEWLKWASLSIGGARWARHPEHEQPEVGALAINNLAQRIEAASRGALPEHLQQELAEADQAERTRLFKQLGSGWETSSAGMEYFRRKAEATSAISRAELSDLIGQTQAMQANRQNRVGFQI